MDHLEKEVKSIDDLKLEFLEYGLTKRPYLIDEIPLLPITDFRSGEKEFLQILSRQKKFNSIDKFREKPPDKFKEMNKLKVKIKLSSLEKRNLI